MTIHGSATVRKEAPHADETTITISDGVKHNDNGQSSVDNVETLVEIICRQGGEAAAALFVLMGTLQNSTEPEALAHAAKHYAFTRCGELNVFGIVDAQITVIEGELLASSNFMS